MEIKKYIEENEQRFIDELFSLIRIPSISAAPKDGDNSSSKPVQTKP